MHGGMAGLSANQWGAFQMKLEADLLPKIDVDVDTRVSSYSGDLSIGRHKRGDTDARTPCLIETAESIIILSNQQRLGEPRFGIWSRSSPNSGVAASEPSSAVTCETRYTEVGILS